MIFNFRFSYNVGYCNFMCIDLIISMLQRYRFAGVIFNVLSISLIWTFHIVLGACKR